MNTSKFQILSLGALLIAGGQFSTHAQQYSIAWSATLGGNGTAVTGAGGGGAFSGGQYSVACTISQVGAGAPGAGGQYVLAGGFWEVPGGPELRIQRTGQQTFIISWGAAALGCFVLQQSGSLDPQLIYWVDVPNAVTFANGADQVTVTITDTAQFYRLVSPCGL